MTVSLSSYDLALLEQVAHFGDSFLAEQVRAVMVARNNAETRLEAVDALCEEWEADDQEHLNTFGQHLPCSLAVPAERLRAALSGEAS